MSELTSPTPEKRAPENALGKIKERLRRRRARGKLFSLAQEMSEWKKGDKYSTASYQIDHNQIAAFCATTNNFDKGQWRVGEKIPLGIKLDVGYEPSLLLKGMSAGLTFEYPGYNVYRRISATGHIVRTEASETNEDGTRDDINHEGTGKPSTEFIEKLPALIRTGTWTPQPPLY